MLKREKVIRMEDFVSYSTVHDLAEDSVEDLR